MKKYITIAALLAAGTAFANAGTFTWNSTDGDFSGFKTTDGKLIAITGDFSLSMTFQLAYYHADCAIQLSPAAGLDSQGSFELGFSGATAKIYTFSADNTSNTSTTGGHFSSDRVVNSAATLIFNFSNYNADTKEYTMSITYPTAWNASDDSKTVSFGGNVVWEKLTLGGDNAKPSVSNLTLSTSAYQVVPEPSAFGMLAGLGALALVAARRRRK